MTWRTRYMFSSYKPETRKQFKKKCQNQTYFLLTTYGCFLKWWYPQNTLKWSCLIGKPMVVGYHHFRKPPYIGEIAETRKKPLRVSRLSKGPAFEGEFFSATNTRGKPFSRGSDKSLNFWKMEDIQLKHGWKMAENVESLRRTPLYLPFQVWRTSRPSIERELPKYLLRIQTIET